jgi:hypothetical protein
MQFSPPHFTDNIGRSDGTIFVLGISVNRGASAVTQYSSTPLLDAGLQWSSLLIAALWRFSRSLWKYRNEVVHGATVDDQAQLQLSQLREKIVQHYTVMRKTPPLFCLDIRSCLPPGLWKSALKLYMTLWLLDFALLTRQFRFYNTMMPICEKSLKCFFVSLNILNKSLIQIPPFPVIPLTLLVLVLWIQQ